MSRNIFKKIWKKYKCNTISKQQRYIHNLYGGELNYSIYPYFLDICFLEENIDFEYDGGAHDLCVKCGKMTKEEFDEKERTRFNFLLKQGYKEFRIVSKTDVLPSDDELIRIKNRAFDLILNQNINSYIYNLDNKTEIYKA